MMKKMRIRTYLVIIVYIYKNIIAATLDCNFDADFCDWQHDDMDDFNWERESYYTHSSNTGPTSDHTTGNGHYIYIEASSKDEGEKSRIISPDKSSGQYCLTFWYSMYGKNIGALNVFLAMNDNEQLIFTKGKNTGSRDWWRTALNIKANESFQVVYEGVIGDGSKGDIAIDDTSIKSGQCSIDCDFEEDFCDWMQYDGDDYNWKRGKNTHDHFIYVDVSGDNWESAMIISPLQNAGKYCLSFWYYMSDSEIDRLQIQLWKKNGSTIFINPAMSAQSRQWFNLTTPLSSQDLFQIVIEGKMNGLYQQTRYLAIDNVTLSSCQDCADPTPNHGIAIIVNSTDFEYGSVIEIKCEHGYNLQGESVIMCEKMENWNGTAACIPHDCGYLRLLNGTFITPNGTTFGKVARQECDIGFVLIGEHSISCTANGWSNTSAYCKLVDCGNLTIHHGTFITPNGTTYGQVGMQECDTGFVLIGEQSTRCTVNGWANTSAYCEIVDCGNLMIPNGTFFSPNGTTFGQVATQECDNGFVLIGEHNIRCTVNGWFNKTVYCKPVDTQYLETDSSPLLAVYVLLPIITLLIVAVIFTVVYIRRRHPSCMKIFKTFQRSTNTPTEVSLNRKSRSNQMYSNSAVQLDDEYASIAEEQNEIDCLNTVYNAKNKTKITKEPVEKHAKDAIFSAGKIDKNVSNTYKVPRTEELYSRIESIEEQDAYYDHACTGRIKTKTLDRDDYSHVGDPETEYQHTFDKPADIQENTDYSHVDRVNINSRLPKHQHSTVKNSKVLEEHIPKIKYPEDQDVVYYNIETNVDGADNKSYFMTEDNEQNYYESDGLENHDYFILEKT